MEFLVKLADKINTQVFCLNPVHRGNHMNRVFYKDDTFEALCPECGSDEFLYRKNNAISKKGHFITYKPDGWTWGTNERKHFGIVRIDCTEAQAAELCKGIRNEKAKLEARTQKDEELQKLAENRAMIDARPRKQSFDFENTLSKKDLKNWNNMEEYSKVIEFNTETINMNSSD